VRKISGEKGVSEIIGTILMLGMAIALFATVSLIIISYPLNTPSPQVDIIGYIEGSDIVFEHHGGPSLATDTQLGITIDGGTTIITVQDYITDLNNNDRWDIGEQIVYTSSNLDHVRVDVMVIDYTSNSVLMMGTIQEGETSSDSSLNTYVNSISSYIQTSSPFTLTASGDSGLDSVSLYYRWSIDNWTSGDSTIFESSFESGEELNNWINDPIRTTASGGYALELDFAGIIGPRTGSYYLGGTGNFDPRYAAYNRTIDVSDYTSVELSVWYSYESTESSDEFGFYWWNATGNSWEIIFEDLTPHIGNGYQLEWQQEIVNIPDNVNSLILQFWWSTSWIEHMMIDDLSITGEPTFGSDWQVWSSTANPDMNHPWQWDFDFPDGPGYYEFYSIGYLDGSYESAPSSADARCRYNP
jgi:flagellin-like protein